MKIGMKHLLATTAVTAVFAPVAAAQENPFLRGRYQSVTERQQPEYDPEVVHVGSFNLNSSLELGVGTDDNVFYQQTNKEDDVVYRIRPSVEARSDWTVHALSVGFTLDHREYQDFDSETSTDYNAFVRGRLDVVRNFQINASVDAGQSTEQRYEPASQNAPEPAQNTYSGIAVTGTYRSDRLQLEVGAGARKSDYQSFFDFRDATRSYISARASYAISPDVAIFAQARNESSSYELANDRDSKQLSLQAGVNFELAAPFSGEISVGTVKNDQDTAGESDTDGLSLDALVRWFPTQLTTVTFRGNAGISDPGLAQSNSSEYRRYSVRADHELFRNLLLYGEFGVGDTDYEPNAAAPSFRRSDESKEAAAGVVYKLNKHAHFDLNYRNNSRDTTGTFQENLDVNVLSLTLRLYP